MDLDYCLSINRFLICKEHKVVIMNVRITTTVFGYFVTNFTTDFFLKIATEFADFDQLCDRKWSVGKLLVEIPFVTDLLQIATD